MWFLEIVFLKKKIKIKQKKIFFNFFVILKKNEYRLKR